MSFSNDSCSASRSPTSATLRFGTWPWMKMPNSMTTLRSGADDHLAHHTSLGQVGERVGNTLEGHLARDRGVDAAGREELHQLAVHVEHERAARIVAAVRAHVHAHDRVVAEQHDVRRHLRHRSALEA